MNIIYLAAICQTDAFITIENNISVAAYRFNKLLAEGLAVKDDVDVVVLVPPSISNRLDKKYRKNTLENKVNYIYLDSNDIAHRSFRICAATYIRQFDNAVIMCDALSVTACQIARKIKKVGISSVGLITDLPQYVGENKSLKEKVWAIYLLYLMKQFDKYILLTRQMTDVINKKGRPQCIIEGVGPNTDDFSFGSYTSTKPRVCMYAGSIHKKYGIEKLVEAFSNVNHKGWQLHIYGTGNYETELETLCKKNDDIFFWGNKPHESIIKAEQAASLLVNPRPTKDAYTQYSFPSKNIEYMASGTPLLTTNLPGMPLEYLEHVYLISNESVSGIEAALADIFTSDEEELQEKGRQAQLFIYTQKNNVVQAEKIIQMLK